MPESTTGTQGANNILAGPMAEDTHQVSHPNTETTSAGNPAPQSGNVIDEELAISRSATTSTHHISSDDPYALRGYKRDDESNDSSQPTTSNLTRRKGKKVKKYYNRQNALIDAYLGSHEEEQLEIEDTLKNGGKVKFAVNASFVVNFFLFIIQMYAAISTGSLSLFATAADAFVSYPRSTGGGANRCRWIL
jgi:hypothetical protein